MQVKPKRVTKNTWLRILIEKDENKNRHLASDLDNDKQDWLSINDKTSFSSRIIWDFQVFVIQFVIVV